MSFDEFVIVTASAVLSLLVVVTVSVVVDNSGKSGRPEETVINFVNNNGVTAEGMRHRKEDDVSVSLGSSDHTGDLRSLEIFCPIPSTTIDQLIRFFYSRHSPSVSPVSSCSVILRIQNSCAVDLVVLSELVPSTCRVDSAPSVIAPIVAFLRLSLTPSKVITYLSRLCGTYVVSCPQHAAWQTKVNEFMTANDTTNRNNVIINFYDLLYIVLVDISCFCVYIHVSIRSVCLVIGFFHIVDIVLE